MIIPLFPLPQIKRSRLKKQYIYIIYVKIKITKRASVKKGKARGGIAGRPLPQPKTAGKLLSIYGVNNQKTHIQSSYRHCSDLSELVFPSLSLRYVCPDFIRMTKLTGQFSSTPPPHYHHLSRHALLRLSENRPFFF